MRSTDFITANEIVSEASDAINDSDFTHGVGKPTYELYLHRAIEEISLATFYNKVTKDIFNWNCSGTGNIATPKNLFNIKEMYLFNSSCDNERATEENSECGCSNDCCSSRSCWTGFVQLHYKAQFNRFGSSLIKTSKITESTNDPVDRRRTKVPNNLYYYGMQNGELCLSDNSAGFKNLRIVANGFGSSNCDLPIVPRELRQVCVDLVKVKACNKIKFVDDKYRIHWSDAKSDLYGDGTVQNPGSWLRAERFIKSMDSKQRNDMSEYFSNVEIK